LNFIFYSYLFEGKYIDFKFSQSKFGEVIDFNVVLSQILKNDHSNIFNNK